MSIHEQALAAADVPYDEATRGEEHVAYTNGFLAGHEAATRTRVVTVGQLTDALYQATQDPDDIDPPDVAKRLHALLYDPEETR